MNFCLIGFACMVMWFCYLLVMLFGWFVVDGLI